MVGRLGRAVMTADGSASLARAVLEELRADPRVDDGRVTISADDRTITLNGAVRTYSEKCCAERITREIRGVAGVKNMLDVRLTIGSYRTDSGLERLTAEILQNHTALCDPLPRVTAREGWLTMDGVVASETQKRSAEETLRDVAGVRGITNNIEVTPRSDGGTVEAFETAVQRRATLAVQELRVEISGMTMSLYGSVSSCAEHDALIELAFRRRGIARVEDHVIVQPSNGERIGSAL